MKSTEKIFVDIYEQNLWANSTTVSGDGSTLEATVNIREALPSILTKYKIRSFLDIPCGDFHWAEHVPLGDVDYLGCDIVSTIVNTNRQLHPNHRFEIMDVLQDSIPRNDMIFCRDCLVHFTFADVKIALANIVNSQSHYFMATTFLQKQNTKAIETGGWAAYNLQSPPFKLPKPIVIINEGCQESYPTFADKSMGLWKINDIANCMR